MTTITTEAIPTTTSSTRESNSRIWRYVATFAAGVALSVAVAAGITAANDDSPSTTNAPTAGAVASHNDQCQMFAGQPC